MNDYYKTDFNNPEQVREFVRILQHNQDFPNVQQELARARVRIERRGYKAEEYSDEDIILPCFEYSSISAYLHDKKRINVGRKTAQKIQNLQVNAKGQFYISYQRDIKQYYETNGSNIPTQEDWIELDSLAQDLNINNLNPSTFPVIMPALDSFNEKLVIAIKNNTDMSEVQEQMNHAIGTLWN